MTFDYLQSKFKQTLYPIERGDPAFEGVYALQPDYLRSERAGVTEQFLEHADDYDASYFSSEHWNYLVRLGLSQACFAGTAPEVLDIGSGSGNSVLPVLDMFGEGRAVATDISPQLLLLLRRRLAQRPDWLERCGLVCADASEAEFHEHSFDIVMGGAILHHLFDPARAIRQACFCLRPGGCAVFFEPFEFGSAMLRAIYERILAERQKLRLSDAAANLLQRVVEDVKVRTGREKTGPIFRQLDDKWLFTRTYFEEQAQANGASVSIAPLHALGESFRDQTLAFLRLVQHAGETALPKGAWEIIRYYDELFSADLKREMLLEGCVVLRK